MNGTIELALVGLVAGLVGAGLGVGGGAILVPGFVLLAGLEPRTAVGTSLLCVVGTAVAATAANLARRALRPGDGLDLPLWGAAGAAAAGVIAVRVPGGIVLGAFSVLLLLTAARMWPRAAQRQTPASAPRPGVLRAAILSGGAVAGLFGVGGGVVFVPVLHLWGGRRFHQAAALSLLIITVTASAGAAVYVVRGDVVLGTALPALAGTLVGAILGVPLAARTRQQWLKAGFSLLLVYVAVEMFREALGR